MLSGDSSSNPAASLSLSAKASRTHEQPISFLIALAMHRPEIINLRHVTLVQRAHDALLRARHAAGEAAAPMPEEFVLADLQDARAALEEIAGRRTPDDLLEHIFARFCVGK